MNIISKISQQRWFIWIVNNPKKVYIYSMIFLTASFIISMTYSIFTYSDNSNNSNLIVTSSVPYAKSNENEVNTIKMKQNTVKMEKIVNELKMFKEKNDRQLLTKEDSVRIDYLYNQYQNLKNGN
ncbi:hypothetical protein HX001_06455 [Empedobacter brevis]|uniref:Uncharacterized protein n=2 Tax=Empedobacter brevis TaxID=247 RepID=A0AAJ1QDR8_9FLAO|nr:MULTISPECIES: hypothetical protein [unclassified Empedobacter]MDM1072136.1 hypothetical protein [Empedobacter brevis]